MANDSGLNDADWRASGSNRGSTAEPTSDLGDDWRATRPNDAFIASLATTGEPGWRPSR
ncbi:hypothetical protein [Mycolicibacterium monacense]|uniref:hypothetical protein n=1 Tax=Mycolicibacterium monacense TaxID=85693 RepID=UPI0013D00F39|nr:hypothetical protein [Mycolicibacterium monacense]